MNLWCQAKVLPLSSNGHRLVKPSGRATAVHADCSKFDFPNVPRNAMRATHLVFAVLLATAVANEMYATHTHTPSPPFSTHCCSR